MLSISKGDSLFKKAYCDVSMDTSIVNIVLLKLM